MNWIFVRYFFNYLFHSKTRQRLLFIAIVGLIISSFALLVIQSTMGGLQSKLIGRSKNVLGDGTITFSFTGEKEVEDLILGLESSGLKPVKELELELLVKYGSYYSPMIVHGLNPKGALPEFLKEKEFEELILPRSLGLKINSSVGDLVRLMSPAHLDSFLGDVPNMVSLYVDYMVSTDVPEIDDFHGWASLTRIQGLVGERVVNKIRLFGDIDKKVINNLINTYGPEDSKLLTWEDLNATLVWALSIDTAVMIFLFSAMTLLVSLAITSGLLIFFSKTRSDLASFWVMGTSEKDLFSSSKLFLNIMTFISVFLGLIFGFIFLTILDYFGPNIMPDVFIDRKIPVEITSTGIMVSFLIPFFVSLTFAYLTLRTFRKDNDYLSFIRTLGS